MFTTNIEVTNNLLKEANKALEEHEFYKATLFGQEASRYNPINPIPYLIQILAEYKVTEIKDLKKCNFDFDTLTYRKLRLYADKELNKELDRHLSKMKGFIDYRNFKNTDEPGNIENEDSAHVNNEDFNSSNYERYESGNVEEDGFDEGFPNEGGEYRKNEFDEVKKLDFSGGIVEKAEYKDRVDDEVSKELSKNEEVNKYDFDKNKTEKTSKNNSEYVDAGAEINEEKYESRAFNEPNSVIEEKEESGVINRLLDFLFDINKTKIIVKINTPLGKGYFLDGESFASSSTTLATLAFLPLMLGSFVSIFYIIGGKGELGSLVLAFSVVLLVIRLVRIFKLNLMFYYRQKHYKSYSAFHYFIRGILHTLLSLVFYALTMFSYWTISSSVMNKDHQYLIACFFLGIAAQKFVYFYYQSIYYLFLNFSYFSRRLFNK